MKEIYLIGCHITNFKQMSMLYELVDCLIKSEKKFIISTHTTIPENLIGKSCGIIYDPRNPVYNRQDIKGMEKYKFSYHTSSFDIYSPYISYGRTKFYGIAAINLLINGINLAKVLEYDTIHWMEYDFSFDIDRENYVSNLMSTNSAVFFKNGTTTEGSRFSFNIKDINKSLIEMNCDELMNMLNPYVYVPEALIYDKLVDGKKFDVISNFTNKYSQVTNSKFEWALFENDFKINIFLSKNSGYNCNVKVICDNVQKDIIMQSNTLWTIQELEKNISIFKIYVNNELIYETEITDEMYVRLIKNTTFIKK